MLRSHSRYASSKSVSKPAACRLVHGKVCVLFGTTWSTVSDGSSHHRSKIRAARGILPPASDTMTEAMLSKSTRLNRIAEVRCLQGFRAARTFELSAPDWLCLGRATSDESVRIPPGYLRTNNVFRTYKSDRPDRTVWK